MVTRENDIDNNIQTESNQYNPSRLSELAQLAIGTRSIADFCEQTQLSKSFVSRILNAKLSGPPSKRTLCKFAGSHASPQNGVRLEDMLVAAGYDTTIDTSMSSKHCPSEGDYETTLTNMVQMHFSEFPAFGLSILINALMTKGYGTEYSIEFQPSVFSLEIKQLTDFDLKIVCIPAFCNSESGIMNIQVSVLTRLILSMSHYAVDKSIFFVMTDNDQLYYELINSLPVVPKMKLAVLLINKDYNGFSKQEIIASKEFLECLEKSDFERFPINFC